MGFEQAALSIASDLDDLELSYALIGGFAVSIRTDPRFTQDIDLVVAVADDDAAKQVTAETRQNHPEVPWSAAATST